MIQPARIGSHVVLLNASKLLDFSDDPTISHLHEIVDAIRNDTALPDEIDTRLFAQEYQKIGRRYQRILYTHRVEVGLAIFAVIAIVFLILYCACRTWARKYLMTNPDALVDNVPAPLPVRLFRTQLQRPYIENRYEPVNQRRRNELVARSSPPKSRAPTVPVTAPPQPSTLG